MADLVNLGDILRLPALGHRAAYVDLRNPDQPRELTAFQLDVLTVSIARGLVNRGIGAGDRVGIVSANRMEFFAAYSGAMRMGAVAVPVNFKLPPATLVHIFRDSEIKLAFTDQARAPLIPGGIPAINFDEESFEAFQSPGSQQTFVPGERELAEILYTSGSGGPPKGVPLTHRGQLWALEIHREPLHADQALVYTPVVAPLYHMNGLFFTTVALMNRMTVISLPHFDPRAYLETVARWRCTVLSGIPTMFAMMVRERELISRLDFGFVRAVTIGSAPLTDTLLGQVQKLFPNADVRIGFGTTEVGPSVFGPHPDGLPKPPLSLGYPLGSIEWRLADGPTSDEGVLALRTPALMDGYLNLPKVTAQKMQDGWYMTGDVLRRDSNGFFFFVGRADDMFVCGGENIYPGEIEKLLEKHAGVAQAAVVPAPDDIKGQVPVAFLIPRPGTRLDADEIKQYALEYGPAYAYPRFVVIRDELPVSGTHKIDRVSLIAEAAELSRSARRASGISC